MFSTGAWAQHRRRRDHHRPGQRRPLGRRPRRDDQPLRWPAGQHVQLRVPDAAGEPAGRRPALLPGPHAGHEPAHPARGQLVLRADPAQHRRHQHAEGRRVRHGRLQVPARATSTGTAAGFTQLTASTVADDPTTTDCDESQLLHAQAGRHHPVPARSTPSTRPASTASPSTTAPTGVDRVFGGNDNDTFWGGDGNDVIEGNGGDDVALGGDGNDIITDLDGADVLKGGPGNDAIDAGPGDDIMHGRRRPGLHQRRRQRQRDVRRPRQRLHHRRSGRRRRVRRRRRRLDRGRHPVRTCCRATTVRRSSTTRRRSRPATTSSSARSARTTTTPRVATT